MAYINGKKIIQAVKVEFVPAVYQVKTLTPSNYTPIVTADTGYAGLSKVTIDGVLVDAHESYTTETDSTIAFDTTVPTNVTKYASIDMVGGMSYKSENELVLADKEATTTNGVTYKAANGVITINGTSTANVNILLTSFTLQAGTYYFKSFGATGDNSTYFTYFQKVEGGTGTILAYSSLNGSITLTETTNVEYRFVVKQEVSVSNIKFKDMLNKGSTVPTTFKQGFNGIRDSAVTWVVCENVDQWQINSNIQALEGYGWGISEDCYNYIDFESKKFIQKVGRVDLGTLTWYKDTSGNYIRFYTTLTDIKIISSSGDIMNGLCAKYDMVSANASYGSGTTGISQQGGEQIIFARDSTYDNYTTTEFQTAMSGVYLYYELATPIETDISSYIDTNYLEVESGGIITFNNEYEQDVPSTITYLVEV